MESFAKSDRTKIKRHPERGVYDKAQIYEILDQAYLAHVGFQAREQVVVLPMTFVRIEDSVYIHGSRASGMFVALAQGQEVCVTVTHLDGLVLARSAFAHSMNYRSVVLFGKSREVPRKEALPILMKLVDYLIPGRAEEVRAPSPEELAQTLTIEIPIVEASAKIRTGPPKQESASDLALPVWAGVVPLALRPGTPEAHVPEGAPALPLPEYLRAPSK